MRCAKKPLPTLTHHSWLIFGRCQLTLLQILPTCMEIWRIVGYHAMDWKELQSLFLRSVCISFIWDGAIRTRRHQNLGSFQSRCSRLPYHTCDLLSRPCSIWETGELTNTFSCHVGMGIFKLTHKNIVRHTGTNFTAHHQNTNSWNSVFRVDVHWVMHP